MSFAGCKRQKRVLQCTYVCTFEKHNGALQRAKDINGEWNPESLDFLIKESAVSLYFNKGIIT